MIVYYVISLSAQARNVNIMSKSVMIDMEHGFTTLHSTNVWHFRPWTNSAFSQTCVNRYSKYIYFSNRGYQIVLRDSSLH
jgi:hypothetical protein